MVSPVRSNWLLGAILALAVAVTVPTPRAAAGDPGEVVVADPAGDVSVQPGAPGVPMAGLADAVDIREVRLYGETGEVVRIDLTMQSIVAEKSFADQATQGIDYGVCFTVGSQKVGLLLNLLYAGTPVIVGGGGWIGVAGSCAATGVTLPTPKGLKTAYVDVPGNRVEFVVPRTTLGFILKTAPPPAGTALGGLTAVVRDHNAKASTRYDVAGPGDGTLVLAYPTSNQDLKMVPESNVPSLPCGRNRDLPAYAIEAGGKRGIPVTVSNPGSDVRHVTFDVRALSGPDWKAKIMPGIEIPAATEKKPGNLTVNVILDTPASTQHRECSTILVRAVDASNPQDVAETSINVVAAVPPTRERNVLYLHSDVLASDVCDLDHVWMNVVENDPADQGQELLMNSCQDAVPLSTTATNLIVGLDVNPSRDLVLNTTVTKKDAKATLLLRSHGPPTNAKIVVDVLGVRKGGFDQYGEGSATATLGETATAVDVPVPIFFTRDFVAEGDPSRTIESTNRLDLAIHYIPLPVDPGAEAVAVAGQVYLEPKGSRIVLPIWDSVKRNVNDPGANGALLSLKALGPTEAFANPGKLRVFNFTVLNEGATTDVAVIKAAPADGNAWGVQVVPPGPFALGGGQRASFAVGITPPGAAPESEGASFEVVAGSQSDPTARSSVLVRVVATGGQQLSPDALGPLTKAPAKKGFLPGLEVPAALAAAFVAVLAGRRRP